MEGSNNPDGVFHHFSKYTSLASINACLCLYMCVRKCTRLRAGHTVCCKININIYYSCKKQFSGRTRDTNNFRKLFIGASVAVQRLRPLQSSVLYPLKYGLSPATVRMPHMLCLISQLNLHVVISPDTVQHKKLGCLTHEWANK